VPIPAIKTVGDEALHIIYVANDNLLTLSNLRNSVDPQGTYINSLAAGAVTVTIQDADSTEVGPVSWPVNLLYVASSNGQYRAVLDDSLQLTADDRYTAIVDVDAGGGLVAHWELPLIAVTRAQ